ncbi:NUDIX domain-containing protein [Pseudooceanicola sp. C21-150M6]|uniref:NUDIX domain-containing protein n=1 Tax=Pseudooceanicola sp. C21-150M6 TaxID=3434355 RepID=UPI003D7F22FA
MRRYGEAPEAGRRYTFRPGAYVILPRGGDILLTHQASPTPEFQLPGGGIDPGEQPMHALHREVFEETGWSIANPRRVRVYRRFTWMPDYEIWAEKLCTIYVAQPVRQIGDPTEPGHTAIWAPIALAPDILPDPGSADTLRQLIRIT